MKRFASMIGRTMMTMALLSSAAALNAQGTHHEYDSKGSRSHRHEAPDCEKHGTHRHGDGLSDRRFGHSGCYRDVRDWPRYIVTSFDVYYDGHEVKGASTLSFRDLGWGYGKDDFSVYFDGRKIDGASAMSFDVLGQNYAKDDFAVYFAGHKVEGASVSSFEAVGWGYAKDAFHAYYCGKRMKDASSMNFKVDSDGYAYDSFNVYYQGMRVE